MINLCKWCTFKKSIAYARFEVNQVAKAIKINKTITANRKTISRKIQSTFYSQTRLKHLTFDSIRVIDKNITFMTSPVRYNNNIR